MFIYRSESKPPDVGKQIPQTDQNINRKLNRIIHSSTSIEEMGMLYIQKETESLKIPIETSKFFTTLDSLVISTENLLDTNLFNSEKDYTISSDSINLHVLKGIQTMENTKILCESEDLKILDPVEIIIMNWDERLTTLTTGMTIEVGDSTVTCKSTDTLKTDLACIKYLRNIAKKSNHIFPTTVPEFFGAYDKYKQTTRNVKVSATHLYLDDTNTGTFACVGDTKPLSEVDMIEAGLKNNFYSTLGKIIFGKLSNLELDIFSIFDTLIELSSESSLDPSLKINEMTYTEMGTKILMYLPIPLQPCAGNTIDGETKPQLILDGLEEYISENKEIEFFEFLKKLVRTHSPPLSRLDLTKTYIIILNFYIRTTNRI